MPLAVYPKCFLRAMVVDRTMSLDEWIELVGDELDVDGLEFHWGFTPPTSGERQAVRERLASVGLSAPMMCYAPDFIHWSPAVRAREIEGQIRAIEATAELGGAFCRVLSGQWKPEIPRDDGLAMAADAIMECLGAAARHGVCLTLENHYKASLWKFPEFARRTEDFLDLLGRIPAGPHFGVNFDPSNALINGDDPIQLLNAVKGRVVTVHASDRYFEGGDAAKLREQELHPQEGYAAFLRHGVIGRGCIDYDRIFTILRAVGFRGWISIEDGDDPSVGVAHLRESAVYLRAKMAAIGLP